MTREELLQQMLDMDEVQFDDVERIAKGINDTWSIWANDIELIHVILLKSLRQEIDRLKNNCDNNHPTVVTKIAYLSMLEKRIEATKSLLAFT